MLDVRVMHARDRHHVDKMHASAIIKSTISANDFCRTQVISSGDLLSEGSGTGELLEITVDNKYALIK